MSQLLPFFAKVQWPAAKSEAQSVCVTVERAPYELAVRILPPTSITVTSDVSSPMTVASPKPVARRASAIALNRPSQRIARGQFGSKVAIKKKSTPVKKSATGSIRRSQAEIKAALVNAARRQRTVANKIMKFDRPASRPLVLAFARAA